MRVLNVMAFQMRVRFWLADVAEFSAGTALFFTSH
jgi:hypothetical protein